MDEEISLLEFLNVLRKRFGLIVIGVLIGILILASYTFLIAVPQYSSTTQLLVNRSQETNVIQRSDIDTNIQLINTYRDLLRSPAILDEVREDLTITTSNQQILNQMNITSENNSQVFSIHIIDPNPNNAALIANTTASVFQEKLDDIMSLDNVTIFSRASVSTTPVSPNHMLNLVIGSIIGGIVSTILAFVIEFKDTTVKDERFITEELGLINLGSVSEILPETFSEPDHFIVSERIPESMRVRSKV